MDIFLRAIAIFCEVVLLAAITYVVLNGVRLINFELWGGPKYEKAVAIVLLAVGSIVVVFFIAHLVTFYPTL